MTTGKTIWFTAGLFCLSLLFACGPGTPPAPRDDAWSSPAPAEPREPDGELVPGLDIWARERARPPQWEWREDLSADYLSRAERHREFMQAGVPVEYRHRRNPYPAETGTIREGGRLYRANCEACHGAGGLGDGVAARDLTPPPAFLSFLIERPRAADQYLFWTIAEGGARFGTEMPAYKDSLTESEIWRIISWMRAGFHDPAVRSGE